MGIMVTVNLASEWWTVVENDDGERFKRNNGAPNCIVRKTIYEGWVRLLLFR